MEQADKNHKITDDKWAELLLQHYQDTFQLVLYNSKVRNHLFIYGLLILAIIIFDACSPNSLNDLFNSYLDKSFPNSKNSTEQISLNFNIIISAIWFLLLCVMLEYYKRSIHVDRQFRYLGKVEKDLGQLMGKEFITREGKAYTSKTGVPDKNESGKRPFCLEAIGFLYTYIFPAVLIIIIIWKACYSFPFEYYSTIFNTVIGCVLILYSAFYIKWMIFEKRKP